MELGRTPTNEELAMVLKVSPQKIIDYELLSLKSISFDSPINNANEKDNMLFADVIANDEDVIDNLIEKLLIEDIKYDIENNIKVSQEKKDIFYMRYGLNGQNRQSIDKLGAKYNLSRSRIDQIEKDVKNKLISKYKKSNNLQRYITTRKK